MARFTSRSQWATFLLLCGFTVLLFSRSALSQGAGSQAGGLPALEQRVAALEAQASSQNAQIAALQATVSAQAGVISAQAARITALEGKTQDMNRLVDPLTGMETVRFSGVNVQVVSGSGATNGVPGDPLRSGGAVNGLGNLIIGYNESDGSSTPARWGSHNLVIGVSNDYTSYGGMVVGRANRIAAPHASVSGGNGNSGLGLFSSVSGGQSNTAAFQSTSVSGGVGNLARGLYSSVSGGYFRTAPGIYDWAAGGLFQDF